MSKTSDKYRNWFDSEQLVSDLMDQAADDIDERDAEIERLREQERKMTNHALERMEEIERLREALKRIAAEPIHQCISRLSNPPVCDRAWIARSALQQKDTE